MFHYNIIIYVIIIDILAIMSPGPDFFVVLKSSLSDSHKAGFYTTLGISCGSTIMFSLGLFGVGAIVAVHPVIFLIVKLLGAGYLTYLGLSSLFNKFTVVEPDLPDAASSATFNAVSNTVSNTASDELLVVSNNCVKSSNNLRKSANHYFRLGLVCNITNPKALLFIISLSTYVASHGNSYTDGSIILLGSLVNTLVWFTTVAYIFGSRRVRRLFYTQQRIINIAFGLILLYVAITIAFL
jgi:threonine/homoserine/homoserine lactone efflux protein